MDIRKIRDKIETDSKIDRIEKYLEAGLSYENICHVTTDISIESLPAYKAHITRRKNKRAKEAEETIKKYARYSDYIVIPRTHLNEKQVLAIAGVLETLVQAPEDNGKELETKVKKSKLESKTLPKSKVREIVIELRNKGVPMKEVKYDPRLKGVNTKKIGAYNAWYNWGRYKKN